MELREAWLAPLEEEVLEPGRPILDPHFHFFEDDPDFPVYRLADLQKDTSRDNVTGAIYMECQQGYRGEGPAHLRPVGESERVTARAHEAAVDHPEFGKFKTVAPPFRMSGHAMTGDAPPPLLAVDTADVLAEAGIYDETIALIVASLS